jgi:carbon-monoxide dehydrogenase small subunit
MNTKKVNFTLNGLKKEFIIDPNEKLLTLLRREGYKGTKFGCGEGSCGTCTVVMDGKAVYSCLLYAFQADGKNIETVESLNTPDNKPHQIQQALIDEGAVQCGYCIPGMVMSAKAMFDENSNPDREFIKTHMDGNLCRCTGYEKIWSAFLKLAGRASKN